jgi:hypothetical protein
MYVCHLFAATSIFLLAKFEFKFKKDFLFKSKNINRGRQLKKTTPVKSVIEAGYNKQPPQLNI